MSQGPRGQNLGSFLRRGLTKEAQFTASARPAETPTGRPVIRHVRFFPNHLISSTSFHKAHRPETVQGVGSSGNVSSFQPVGKDSVLSLSGHPSDPSVFPEPWWLKLLYHHALFSADTGMKSHPLCLLACEPGLVWLSPWCVPGPIF